MQKPHKKVTMSEVALKAQVSKATVSRALGGSSLIGNEVRAHVEKVAEALGYVRKTQRRHAERSILTVKVVLPPGKETSMQLFYSFRSLLDGLRDGLKPSVANVIVETYQNHYQPFPHKKGGEIDAFVFAFHRPSSRVLAEIQERGASCVVLNRIVRGVRQVVSDHRDALYQIASHLGERGVKGNCCFVGYRGIEDVWRARVQGFVEGCEASGIEFEKERDCWLVSSPEGLTIEAVKAQYDLGVRNFIGVNDVVGIILMQQLRRLDLRIPEDVRVTGCDRSPVYEITYPRLTSVDLSMKSLAREVGRSLQCEIVEKEKAKNVLLVKGALLIGETT